MPAPQIIQDLVERFERNLPAYRSGSYNETQVRREFLDPLFESLGWDVFNKQGYAESYKDVIHEDAIRVGGATKAPDYCFRIGGTRMFFVEAKKPSVNIKDDISPAFQLRRYAWSAKLPLSILTDFEELAVYDCRNKPDKSDKASTGRTLLMTFREYPQRWDELADIFSREAVLKGSFDRYAQTTKGKRGTADVDNAFLSEIERWREILARNLALRNPQLTQRSLNFAVQMIIDRIIFLRICEDRGIEFYGALQSLLNGGQVYQRMATLFAKADQRYNSGLFHFHPEKGRHSSPDTLTLGLTIDDKHLKDILRSLYYPDSPYEFSVLPAEILGQVYEQFLGKVIRLTPGHKAMVEDKPEVKKAGGVFYTPSYIVDYIVQQTVGTLLKDKTPRQAGQIKILDPACGSGSFLLGAYQYLLDWHRDWYVANDPLKWAKGSHPALYQGLGGEWRLTSSERKRILLNNIYGVDIDTQAVEVTKLSLLLKVLEGENQETLGKQLSLFQERALPDLGENIKCGNSLIGPDYFDGQVLPNEAELSQINPFDWQHEFPEAMVAGGFDGVIGNPPWGATFSAKELTYFRTRYKTAQESTIDSYAIFIEIALNKLKSKGVLSYITPDTFLRKDNHLRTRELILKQTSIMELVETGPVFSKVRDTWCLIFSTQKIEPDDNIRIRHRKISRFVVSAEARLNQFYKGEWDIESETPQSLWMRRPKMIVGYLASEGEQNLIIKMETHPRLGQLKNQYRVSRGEEGSKFALEKSSDGQFFMVIPKDIERYAVAEGIQISQNSLTSTKVTTIYEHPKIWLIRIQKMRWRRRLVCGLDVRQNSAGMKTLQAVVSTTNCTADLKYLQAILASSLMNFWCTNYLADDMNQSYLEKLPIRSINFDDPSDVACHDQMVALVEQMLDLNKRLAGASFPAEQMLYERQIESTDRQIDALVYELYGLSDEDIRIVEEDNA
jgi:hypothetical protein